MLKSGKKNKKEMFCHLPMVGAIISNGGDKLAWLSSFFGGTFLTAVGGASKLPTGISASFDSATLDSGSRPTPRLVLARSSASLMRFFFFSMSKSLAEGWTASVRLAGKSPTASRLSMVGVLSRSSNVLAGWSLAVARESGGRMSLCKYYGYN